MQGANSLITQWSSRMFAHTHPLRDFPAIIQPLLCMHSDKNAIAGQVINNGSKSLLLIWTTACVKYGKSHKVKRALPENCSHCC